MNPVRAGMVDHPAKYRWSSYATNALGMSNSILHQHDEYVGLGASTGVRQKVYQELFDYDLASGAVELLKQSLQSGTPLGNDYFRAQIEATLGRKIGRIAPGRPKKKATRNIR